MNKLLLPAIIFASVIGVGKICEQLGVDPNVKVGLLCLVALVVQIGVRRYQRSREDNVKS